MNKKMSFSSTSKFIKIVLLFELLTILLLAVGLFGKNINMSFKTSDFRIEEDDGYIKSIVRAPGLKSGVYKVNLQYKTDADMSNVWSVSAEDISYDGLFANTCMLYSGEQHADMYIWLTEPTDNLSIEVKYEPESQMLIYGASIQETNMGNRVLLVLFCMLFFGIDLYLWKRANNKSFVMNADDPKALTGQRAVVFMLGLTILVASIPLFTGYEIAAADTGYHLLRIEGVKEGLLAGQFPVRIQPNWLQGYGYATGIFYCDTYLYIPALLRMAGFPIGMTYLFYKFLINVATVLLTYVSFNKIFQNKWAAIWGTMLYSFNIYRLLCMYLKDHLGQYTAMTFLPLLAYSVWRLLEDDVTTEEYKTSWIALTIAATCIVQCHVLTCELVLLFCVVVGIVFWRKIIRKETLKQLVIAITVIIGLNLWFLVPFADYMSTQHLNITGENVYTRVIQGYGSLLPQLLGVFALAGGSDKDVFSGMQNEIPFTVGIALLITLLYFIYLWYCGAIKNRKMKICAILAIVSLFMATAYFPWDRIQTFGGFTAKLVSALQYPTRMLEISGVFLSLLACSCIVVGFEQTKKESLYLYIGIVMVSTIMVTGMFFSTLLSQSGFYKLYEADAMGNAYLSGKEYLPEGTDETLLKAGRYIVSDNISVTEVDKQGSRVVFACINSADKSGYVELPLLYYKGYVATLETNGLKTGVLDGDNHVVRVSIPSKYDGKILVDFESPWYWRMAEIISVIFLIGFIFVWRKENSIIKK